MNKFTPGPWTYSKRGKHWNNPKLERIEINYGKSGECIADTVYEEADAMLIAAAPMMLDALEKADELIDLLIIDNNDSYAEERAQIRAAIRAAKGE